MDERDPIDKLTRAVADRSPVTWDEELRSVADDEGRAVVEQLQLVDRIVDVHWGIPDTLKHLDDFEVIREIDRGRMGVVYEARQVSLDRRVAIKVLPSEVTRDTVRIQRFQREAKSLAAMNHPNIVTIYSVEKSGGLHFINMELVDGRPLSAQIPRRGMSIDDLLDVAIPMADALSSAHEHQIVHRDLKPANVMISHEGRVKVLDFGLAKLWGDTSLGEKTALSTVDLNVTSEGFVVGTIPYMSPEQASGGAVDHRSDVFSMGIILYEMATGRRPFNGLSERTVITAIANETPPPVTEVKTALPADLDRIISLCLRKDPERRYQTAKDLRNELKDLKTELEMQKLLPRPINKWMLWAAVSTVTVLMAALVVVLMLGWPLLPTPPSRYLAVMPFKHTGEGSAEISAFSDGLTDILTAKLMRLTKTHDLQIAPAGRVRRDPPLTVETIGEELGVTLALDGVLQRSGNDVRVTINLTDVREQKLLGAEIINVALSDPFAFQDQVVVTAVEMLDLEMPPLEIEALRAHGTTVAAANELYLQGRGYLSNYDQPESVDRAISVFEEALAKDPDYAQAHAGLGMAYWKRYEHDQDPQWVDRASEACEDAVELDNELAAAHACLGTVFLGRGHYGVAMTEFGWAISQDPTNDEAYQGLAEVFERLDQPDSAEEVYLKAVSERPHYWATHNWLGAFYYRHGRVEEAEKSLARVIALAPNRYRGYQNLGGVYLLQGKYADAIRVLERSVKLKPTAHGYSNLASAYFSRRQFDEAARYNEKAIDVGRNDYAVWGNLAEAYYWTPGGRAKAREPYLRAIELAEQQLEINPDAPEILGELGKYHAMLGDREEALECLTKAAKMDQSSAELEFNAAVVYSQLGEHELALDWLERSRASGMQASWIRDNPVFDRLHRKERFQQLIR